MKILKRLFQSTKSLALTAGRYSLRHKGPVLATSLVVVCSLVSYDIGSRHASSTLSKAKISEAVKSLETQARSGAVKQAPPTPTPSSPKPTNTSNQPTNTPSSAKTKPATTPAVQQSRVAGISSGQFRISGRVAEITNDGMVIETVSSNVVTIITNNKTQYYTKDGAKSSVDKISKDSGVVVQVRIESEGQFVAARVQAN